MVAVLIEKIVWKGRVEKPIYINVLLNQGIGALVILASTKRVTISTVYAECIWNTTESFNGHGADNSPGGPSTSHNQCQTWTQRRRWR